MTPQRTWRIHECDEAWSNFLTSTAQKQKENIAQAADAQAQTEEEGKIGPPQASTCNYFHLWKCRERPKAWNCSALSCKRKGGRLRWNFGNRQNTASRIHGRVGERSEDDGCNSRLGPHFHRNFRRLVLFCMNSYDSESGRIFQHFSRSKRFTFLCTASNTEISTKLRQTFRDFYIRTCRILIFFLRFIIFLTDFDENSSEFH